MIRMNGADSRAIVESAYDRMDSTPKKKNWKTVEPDAPVTVTKLKAKLPKDVKWKK